MKKGGPFGVFLGDSSLLVPLLVLLVLHTSLHGPVSLPPTVSETCGVSCPCEDGKGESISQVNQVSNQEWAQSKDEDSRSFPRECPEDCPDCHSRLLSAVIAHMNLSMVVENPMPPISDWQIRTHHAALSDVFRPPRSSINVEK